LIAVRRRAPFLSKRTVVLDAEVQQARSPCGGSRPSVGDEGFISVEHERLRGRARGPKQNKKKRRR